MLRAPFGASAACSSHRPTFGAEDYITDVGGFRTDEGAEVLYARSAWSIPPARVRVPTIDQVVLDFKDDSAFERYAHAGRSMGYTGKLCIHPRQALLANGAFAPSKAEVRWAARVIEGHDRGAELGRGVFEVDGQMVDAPIVARARPVLADALWGDPT